MTDMPLLHVYTSSFPSAVT